jgi:hypothetical protein
LIAAALAAVVALGSGIACDGGYQRVHDQLLSRASVEAGILPAQAPAGLKLMTVMRMSDNSVWRLTTPGHPAHPAVAALAVTSKEGQPVKTRFLGACGYGDRKAFDRFVGAFKDDMRDEAR